MTAGRRGAAGAVLLLLLVVYLAVSLRGLDTVPPVHEDEPWIASSGFRLAQDGVFGSAVFTGFHGMDRHVFAFMPVYPLLLAAAFKTAGAGLVEARLVVVGLGLLVLVLTYRLARRLFGSATAVLAVTLLLCARLHATTAHQVSGILFVDVSRIARYDMVVAVFGLLSLHACLEAMARSDRRLYVAAGVLAALAGLGNVYGFFWIFALMLLAWMQRRERGAVAAIVAGAAVPCALYAGYALASFADWQGQTRWFGPRVDLLNPSFYWQNVRDELQRYAPGLGAPGWHYLARPAIWVLPPAMIGGLWALARRTAAGDRAAAAIVVPSGVFIAVFAVLIQKKAASYAVTLQPLLMIAAASALVLVWRRVDHVPRGAALRVALAGVVMLIAAEGAARLAALRAAGRTTTPYYDAVARLRAHVAPGSRILGLHAYWFGFEDHHYVSWFAPIVRADRSLYADAPPLEQALDEVGADVILIDHRMRSYFAGAPASDPVPATVAAWMAERGFRLAATVSDRTYGEFEIFELRRGGGQ